MPRILLVTERPLSDTDVVDLTTIDGAKPSDLSFYVAVPQVPTSASVQGVLDNFEYLDAGARGASEIHHHAELEQNPADATQRNAELILAETVAALTSAGSTADGEITPEHPLETIGDLLDAQPVDEVVVVVSHHKLSGAFHADLAAHVKRSFDVPVLRVKSHRD